MHVRFHYTRGESSEGHIRVSSWREAAVGKVQAISVWESAEHLSVAEDPPAGTVPPDAVCIVRFWSLNRLERL